MKPWGGFDHNVQTFRVITRLEVRYPAFEGLNLTWETLEGVVKHNGPVSGLLDRPAWRAVVDFDEVYPLELGGWASAEAQVAALSDDIAYNNHDVDDGLRAGLFDVEDLKDVPLVGPVFAEVMDRHPGLEPARLIHEAVSRLIDRMVNDLIEETRRRLRAANPRSTAALRRLGHPVVGFSPAMVENDRALKRFLFERMYRHHRVNRMTAKARRVVRDLFELYLSEPECLPGDWREQCDEDDKPRTTRVVADYIAGMTDRYALDEHRRLFDPYTRP